MTNSLISCRLPGGNGKRPFFGKMPACPEGDGGFYGTPATVREAASFCGIMRRLAGLGEKASRRIRLPGARPLAGCRAAIGGKRNGYGVRDNAAPRGGSYH
jgi:hypothetical protein